MLDRIGRALFRGVGILAKFFTRPALTEKIPQAVELDVDVAEAPAFVGRHGTLALEERVLFADQRVDMGVDGVVVHVPRIPLSSEREREMHGFVV